MYISLRYNIVFDYDDNSYIFNTASGALACVSDRSQLSTIVSSPERPFEITKPYEDDFLRGGFLVSHDYDEIAAIKQRLLNSRSNLLNQEYIVCLSYLCNLECSYCFEREWDKSSSSTSIDQSILSFLKNRISQAEAKRVRVNWSGGEPLLFADRIASISTEFADFCLSNGVKYRAKLTSNMTLSSPETISFIKQSCVSEIQVTLDGHRETHDKYRVSKNLHKTYDLIMDNICKTLELLPKVEIVIRINISRESFPTVHEILNDLDNSGLHNKVRIAFSRLRSVENSSFCIEEYARVETALYKLLHEKDWKVFIHKRFRPRTVGCGAYTKRSYSITPDLSVLKCWEMASSKCNVVGHIKEDGSLVLNQRECAYIELDPTEVDECQSCVYLPLCMGGCAVDRSKTHEIDNTDLQLGRNCSTLKYNLVDMLKLYISLAPVTTSSL